MDVDQCPRESRALQSDYTSKEKITAFSLDEACWRATDTTSCASPTRATEEKNLHAPTCCARCEIRSDSQETSMKYGLSTRAIFARQSPRVRLARQRRAQISPLLQCAKCAVNVVKKNWEKPARATPLERRIRSESSKSARLIRSRGRLRIADFASAQTVRDELWRRHSRRRRRCRRIIAAARRAHPRAACVRGRACS